MRVFGECDYSFTDAFSDTLVPYDGGCNGTYNYSDNGNADCGDAWSATFTCDSSKPADSTDRWSGTFNSCPLDANFPDDATQPDALGSCSVPPTWWAECENCGQECPCCDDIAPYETTTTTTTQEGDGDTTTTTTSTTAEVPQGACCFDEDHGVDCYSTNEAACNGTWQAGVPCADAACDCGDGTAEPTDLGGY